MVGIDRFPQDRVELRRWHSFVALPVEPLCRVDHRLHVAAAGRRHERHRRPGHRAERVPQVVGPLAAFDIRCIEIPFVDDEHHRLCLLHDRVGQLLVDAAHRLRGVEEEQHDVCPADAPLRAVGGVEVDVGLAALRPPQARRVDGEKRVAVHVEPHIDRVAGRARHGAGNHPLLVGQTVDERALAHVPPAHDRELHLRQFGRGFLAAVFGLRQPCQDRLDERLAVAVLPRTHDQRLAEAERGELMGVVVELGVVGFVGNEQDRHADFSHADSNLTVGRHDPLPDIDDKQHDRRLDEARLDLGVDPGGEAVGVVEAHAAGVDQIDRAALQREPLHEPVACHACRRILDGDPLLDEPVEEGRFADIGSANNCDLGDELENQRCISGVWGVDRSRPIGGRDHHARPTQLTSPTEIWWQAPF